MVWASRGGLSTAGSPPPASGGLDATCAHSQENIPAMGHTRWCQCPTGRTGTMSLIKERTYPDVHSPRPSGEKTIH